MKAICLMALMASIGLIGSGCGNTSIYLLDQKEIVKVKSGETISSTYDGYFFSNRAISRVMKAKVEDIKLK